MVIRETQAVLEEELGLSPHVLGRGIFQGQHHINGLLESTDAQLKEDLALLVRGKGLCARVVFVFCFAQEECACLCCLCHVGGWVGGCESSSRHMCARLSSPFPFPPFRPSGVLGSVELL